MRCKRMKQIVHFEAKGSDRDRCADVYSHFEGTDGELFLLSDGVTGSKYGTEAASRIHRAISDCLRSIPDFSTARESDIQLRIASATCETIYHMQQEKGCCRKDLASTLLAIFVPTEGNDIWTIHIGDGMIGWYSEGKWSPLSYPQNGMLSHQTFTTANQPLSPHVRVQHFLLSPKETQIIMATDGLDEFYDRVTLEPGPTLSHAIKTGNWECILSNSEISDDASIVKIKLSEIE